MAMALFGFGEEKKDEEAADLVLAYVEDALRTRTLFHLSDGQGKEITAHLIGLAEEQGLATFQLQGALPGGKGSQLQAVFLLDGLRIGGICQVVSTRTGQADLALPEQLEILERRKQPRAKLNPREGATLTALTGLFDGTGMTGLIENLSETGARMRVERAMEIRGEKKLSLHSILVAPNHPFDILKLSKLPRLPGAWECSGRCVYLEGGGAALYLGVAFDSFPAEALGALRSLINHRVGSLPSILPPKARRKPEAESAASPTRKVAEPALPAIEEIAPPAEPVTGSIPEEAASSKLPGPDRNSALFRLKKRSRTLVVVASPGNAHLVQLTEHLHEEGYGKILLAETLQELLDLLQESSPNLVFIEDGVAELKGLDLVEALRRVHPDLPPLLLALEDVSTATVLAARRFGVASLMVKPYQLDDAFSAILEDALGL